MQNTSLLTIASILSFGAFAACSTTTIITTTHGAADGGDMTDEDAGVDMTVDAGTATKDAGSKKDAGPQMQAPPVTQIPQVTYNGGALLYVPNIVTVTFDSNVQRTFLESFGSTIATTPWWDAVRAGYCDSKAQCIQKGVAGSPVHLPTASASGSYTDSSSGGASTMHTFIDGLITSHTLPAPTANTLYMIYFPSTTNITLDGAGSCQQFGGYHSSLTATLNGVNVAYAIMPDCNGGTSELTIAASHELIEAATDPFLSNDPQNPYSGYGSLSDAWDVIAGGEVGDRCFDYTGQSLDQYQEGAYKVQRSFSNTAAKGNHDPCVPAPPPSQQPYFNVSPNGGDVLNIAVGASQTVEVDAFSDAPESAILWDAVEMAGMGGNGSDLTLSVEGQAPGASGQLQIGGKGHLKVTLNTTPSNGFATFVLRAQSSNNVLHTWPMVVQP